MEAKQPANPNGPKPNYILTQDKKIVRPCVTIKHSQNMCFNSASLRVSLD